MGKKNNKLNKYEGKPGTQFIGPQNKSTAECSTLDKKRKHTNHELPKKGNKEAPEAETETKETDSSRSVIVLESGLQCVEVIKGTGPLPQRNQNVFIQYKGILESDGRVFDSGKFSFRLGRGEVVEGMDEGVAGMRQGGVRKIRVPPHLAYGTQGARAGGIPPNATLLFDVYLVRIGTRKQASQQEEDAMWIAKGGTKKGIEDDFEASNRKAEKKRKRLLAESLEGNEGSVADHESKIHSSKHSFKGDAKAASKSQGASHANIKKKGSESDKGIGKKRLTDKRGKSTNSANKFVEF